ncbi:hypothetical protein BFJ69_g18103 [Fusarium oxysporum]|uniref:Uncharacterized protein n=1 Tax=Fusarium oxysporum TaxID=5507 RepID=A0A420M6F1_FUSOX|nr:hypothetical protein BFJ69_g18103 [Fusarium oxysporum]
MQLLSFVVSTLVMVRRREVRHAPDRIWMLLSKHFSSES